jgi:hypothetical protein
MIAFDQTGAAVVGAVVVAGLFILSLEGQTRAFAIPPRPANARDAAIAHLTNRARTAAKGKLHA